jgi:hypothetical protein
MTDSAGAVARTTARRVGWLVGTLVALLVLAGCSGEAKMGTVTGAVTVDGQVPAEGSSITFFPTDGKSRSAGALIEQGKYSTSVPVGEARVEIRVPRPARTGKGKPGEGPGGPGGDIIEESLPAKYNDKTELKYDVKPGRNEKNWELKTK